MTKPRNSKFLMVLQWKEEHILVLFPGTCSMYATDSLTGESLPYLFSLKTAF